MFINPLNCFQASIWTRKRARLSRWAQAAVTIVLLLAMSAESGAEEVRLQLKWYHQFQFAGYYAAETQGYFRNEGLDVTIIEGAPDRPPLRMMHEGKADFGISDADVLVERMKGEPVVACAAIFQHSPYVLISLEQSGIRVPSDLIGRSVMISGDQGAAQFRAMILREGLPLEKVTLLPHSWDLDDLISGKVDAISGYLTTEPAQLRARGVRVKLLRASDYGVDFYGDTLFTTDEFAARAGTTVEGMVRAIRRGWDYAMANPSEMIDQILTMPGVQERGITRENLEYEAKTMRPLIMGDVVEVGHMNPGRWMRMAEACETAGIAAHPRRSDWFDGFLFQLKPAADYRRVAWWLAIGGGVGLLGAGWALLLRRQVSLRTREVVQGRGKLHAVLHNSGNVLGLLDAEGILIEVNRTALEFAGTTRDAVLGKPFCDSPWWQHSEDLRELITTQILLLREKPQTVNFETTHPDSLGARTLDFTLRPVTGVDHNLLYIVAEGIDITGRKAAAEALELSRRDLAALIDHTRGLMWSVDPSMRLVKFNRQFHEAFRARYARDVQAGGVLLDYFDGAERERWRQWYERALAGEQFSAEFECGTGTERMVCEVALHPMMRKGAVSGVTVIKFDITERKQIAEALERSAELNQLVLDNALDAVISLDSSGRVVQWNAQAGNLFGMPREQAVGRPLEDIVPGLCARLTGDPAGAPRYELSAHRADGTCFPAEVSVSRLPDRHDIAVNVFIRDVTEQKMLADRLRQSQKMEAIGKLAGGVAHDFNNLLTVIQGNAASIEYEDAPDVAHSVNEILAASERASSLTRQLLAFSRQQPLQPQHIQVNESIAAVCRMLRRLIGEDIRIETPLCEEATLVKADRGMLEQVLLNLAVNGRDAMQAGGILTLRTRRVELRDGEENLPAESAAGEYICTEVSDTGTGIPEADLPHIFEPFFTTKEVGKGTGLGLATVFGIVRQHGGWVAVNSKVGEGTTFSIWLPAVAAPVPRAGVDAVPVRRGSGRGDETVLLVEDEEMVRIIVRQILTRHGYSVIEAASGYQALKVWSEHRDRIDVLLTDIVMPEGVSGHDLAQRLQAEKEELKVIYTSGYTAEVFRGSAEFPENVAFLGKPYRPEDLLREIRGVLDRDLLPA